MMDITLLLLLGQVYHTSTFHRKRHCTKNEVLHEGFGPIY